MWIHQPKRTPVTSVMLYEHVKRKSLQERAGAHAQCVPYDGGLRSYDQIERRNTVSRLTFAAVLETSLLQV